MGQLFKKKGIILHKFFYTHPGADCGRWFHPFQLITFTAISVIDSTPELSVEAIHSLPGLHFHFH